MGRLDGKITLVTGGTSGIGEATSRLFANEGAKVIVVGRNSDRGNQLCDEIKKDGGDAEFEVCDVTDSALVNTLRDRINGKYGRLDTLVNCAGIWDTVLLEDITDEYWDMTYKTNTSSVMYFTRAFHELLKKANGSIINVASVGGLQSHIAGTKQYAYASAKAAVIQFSQLCALNFAPEVRVNTVCPGPTDTPIFTNKDFSRFYDSIPMHRVGKPEDPAKAMVFLASDDASYITGAILTVDGGASLV